MSREIKSKKAACDWKPPSNSVKVKGEAVAGTHLAVTNLVGVLDALIRNIWTHSMASG